MKKENTKENRMIIIIIQVCILQLKYFYLDVFGIPKFLISER